MIILPRSWVKELQASIPQSTIVETNVLYGSPRQKTETHITYINVLRCMSVDCDCAGTTAAAPKLPDLGILASKDILALDKASVDLALAQPKEQSGDLKERIESRKGLRQLTYMQELGMGNPNYELVEVK